MSCFPCFVSKVVVKGFNYCTLIWSSCSDSPLENFQSGAELLLRNRHSSYSAAFLLIISTNLKEQIVVVTLGQSPS